MQVNSEEMAIMRPSQPFNDELESTSIPLLRRAKTGDAGAFEEIMVQHERLVVMTALRLLGRLEDAQDAAQEVFLRFYKYLSRIDESRRLSPWLYRVTVNVCRDIARKRPKAPLVSLDDAGIEEIADPHGSEASANLVDQKRIVTEGLKTLSKKERAALVLRDIEGLSTKEVARILGSSEMTVRSHVSRARVKIKKFRDRFLGRNKIL